MSAFKQLYSNAKAKAAKTGRPCNEAAIYEMAKWISNGTLSIGRRGHLTKFALPLGVKRALDYADFFEASHPTLEKLKREQAAAFGRCLSYVMLEDWNSVGKELNSLASFETKIEGEITAAHSAAR